MTGKKNVEYDKRHPVRQTVKQEISLTEVYAMSLRYVKGSYMDEILVNGNPVLVVR